VLSRFLLVGATNFLVSYAVFLLAMAALPALAVRALLSQALSYAAGIGWSFVWNRRYTFRSTGSASAQLRRFLALQLALLAASSLALWALVDRAGLNAHACWFGVMTLVTLVNYWLSRRWVFR
jgi:putative flippase GtrA